MSEESPKGGLRGVFPRDGMWGHKIVFDDFEERRVYGFLTPRASDGDLFGYQMESGQIGVFELVNVDNKLDPSDQFFAEANDVGYLGELDGVEDDCGSEEQQDEDDECDVELPDHSMGGIEVRRHLKKIRPEDNDD